MPSAGAPTPAPQRVHVVGQHPHLLETLQKITDEDPLASSTRGIPHDKAIFVFPIGHINALNFALGLTLGLALFSIGAGAVHWARTLMSDVEIADERHAIEATAKVLADFKQGAKESALGRRKLIRNTMFGTLALFPLSGVMLLRDLGPLPGTKLRHTICRKGKLLVNMNTNEPLRPSDVQVGSLTLAKPQGLEEHDEEFQTEIAKAALMIVRLQSTICVTNFPII